MRLDPALCSEDAIARMVHAFHASVRQDDRLAPVFDAHIADWPTHLARMVDFWTSVLLGCGRYSGTPMPAHQALPQLDPALFARWLQLFEATTQAVCEPAMKARADELARRIAQSLWLGWQMANRPRAAARGLGDARHVC
ncbi:MAG: group III truncated hemoglobin [Thiomonas sp.]